MTRKDYSAIQRNLGYIEGVLICIDDDHGALDRICMIDEILDKEELTDELPDDAGGEVPYHFRNITYTDGEVDEEREPVSDWCKECKYIDIDGADIPCCECVWSDDGSPTGFKAKEPPMEELEK